MQSLETFCQGAKKKQCKRIRQWSNHLGHSASGSKSRWLQPSHAWCEANPCHCAPNVGRYTFHAKVDKYATFYFGHCKDFYMDQARNSWISLIIVGGTIKWRGCSRKLFRAGKPQREREADARTFGWIWLEKVRVGDASGRNCRRRGGRTGKMKMRANMQRYRETYMKM